MKKVFLFSRWDSAPDPGIFKAFAKKCLVGVKADWYPDEKEKALKV
jgi:hypothetical protein